MLKSYEAIYENGQLKWLAETPPIQSGRVIVTILEDNSPPIKPRTSPHSIAEKGKTLGEIVNPIVDEEEWKSSLLQVLSTLPKLDEEFPDCDQNLPPLEDIEM